MSWPTVCYIAKSDHLKQDYIYMLDLELFSHFSCVLRKPQNVLEMKTYMGWMLQL
jgi:hypothetical protein